MTTQVVQTNGNILATISDFSTNSTASSIILSGRGSMNMGAAIQDNMIGILENFSYPTAPKNPLVGQLWYQPYYVDNNNNKISVERLNLYTNDTSVSSSGWVQIAMLTDISDYQGQINTINSEISLINTNINGNNQNIQNQINSINTSLTNLQSQISTNQNNISTLQQNISDINNKFTTVDGQFNSVNDQITDINNKFSPINSSILDLQEQTAETNSNIQEINSNFQNYLPLTGGTINGNIDINGYIKTDNAIYTNNINTYTDNTINLNNNVNVSGQIYINTNPTDTPDNITTQVPNTWWVNQYFTPRTEFSNSTITNIILPGNIRMQMFYANIPNGGRVTFPTAFSSTPSGVQITVAQNVDADHYFVNLDSTGCNIGYFGNNAPTVNFCIFVIGPV